MYKEAARLDGANRVKEFLAIVYASTSDSVDYDGSCDEPDRRLQAVRCDCCDVKRWAEPEVHVPFVLHFASRISMMKKAGYASAVGIMTFFIILIVALPVNMYLRKKEVEY